MTDKHLCDPEGFWRHCEVIEMLFKMGVDPHTRHHINSAIRQASNKVHNGNTQNRRRGAHYMSNEAAMQIRASQPQNLVVDHVVPVKVITNEIFDLKDKDKTQKNIGNLIRDWTILAVITHEQHEKLRTDKLYDRMPDDWEKTGDKLARYRKLGIVLKDNEF